jgi:hypothetical protein
MSKFEITALNKIINVKSKIPNFMPYPPFRMCVYANSFSGKSTMICNILKKKQFGYKDYFKDNIFLLSKTVEQDDIYNCLKLKEENIKKSFDEDFINSMMEEQEENIKNMVKIQFQAFY